ncbi:hypothetical protein [Azospirillum sp. sgz302134]
MLGKADNAEKALIAISVLLVGLLCYGDWLLIKSSRHYEWILDSKTANDTFIVVASGTGPLLMLFACVTATIVIRAKLFPSD